MTPDDLLPITPGGLIMPEPRFPKLKKKRAPSSSVRSSLEKPERFLRVGKIIDDIFRFEKAALRKAKIKSGEKHFELSVDPRSLKKAAKGQPSKHYAPYGCVSKLSFYGICATRKELDQLYDNLIDAGYIDIYGNILKQFKNIRTAQALEINPKFNAAKDAVYDVLGSVLKYRHIPYHTTGGSDKLRVEKGDIKKGLHERLDFDDRSAYIGVLLRRQCWMSKLHPQQLEKWEQEEAWKRMPVAPVKHSVMLRKGRKQPSVNPQELFPPDAKMLTYYLSRKIDSSYLRWRHSDIEKFLDGYTRVNPEKLFRDIVSAYRRYCYFESEDTYYLLALWIIGTYLFPLFPAYPLILLNGPMGSGKSRTTKVSSCMAFNADPMIDPTNAAIFRRADKNRASLFFDDAEWLTGTTKTRLLSTLKSSYKNTAKATRVGLNKDGSIDEYEIYSPKMFNNIYGIDVVMADRTIIITQKRTLGKVKLDKHDPDENDPYWAEIRNRLYLFTFNYWQDIKELRAKQARLPLRDRAYELYMGILSIAQFLDSASKRKGLHKLIFESAMRDVEERKSEYLKTNPEALTIQALLSLVLADGWYSIPKIEYEIKTVSDSPREITSVWTGKILKSLGFGRKRDEWRRLRNTDGRRVSRPTEYYIRKRVVADLAKQHGVKE